ncbi:MAG: helicase-associated domain-containing protein [Sphaerobacter sp.]|nr:helicase-associated domain-containing protein [Sphaerobacter sp.]
MRSERCLIFQRDRTILVSTGAAAYPAARDGLRQFAELVQAAGAYHTYRVTELALWSAAAGGLTADAIVAFLERYGVHPPPRTLVAFIQEIIGRYGLLRLSGPLGGLRLTGLDRALLARVAEAHGLCWDGDGLVVPDAARGAIKAALADAGYPVVDEAVLAAATPVRFALRPGVRLRPYQAEAVRRFTERAATGGVVLLPCGAGKTVVGVAIAARLQAATLIITPSRTIGEQWLRHLREMTTLPPEAVGEYVGGREPPAVTVLTYQRLTARANGRQATLGALLDWPWGLVIYDEVHALPAEVFRQSASLQSRRRLGLTATLVREDGRERDVFALVGPTVYAVPWRDLERRGWIAAVDCVEVRVQPSGVGEASADRLLAAKLRVVRRLARRHAGEPTLVVAHRLTEVAAVARALGAPMVTGQTPAGERRALYDAFRRGETRCLALSRVANVGVDLPDAAVLIQLSGAFGSRQEEAQRLGRLLRPKKAGQRATFYTLVVPGTREVEFAARRQRFLVDQGYRYRVVDAERLAAS